MRHFFVACILLLGFALSAFSQSGSAPKSVSPFEHDLVKAETSYLDAVRKGDSAFLKHTLADNFAFVGSDGQFDDRQEFIDELGSGGEDVSAYDMKVVAVSDDVGIVSYDTILRAPADDDNPEPRYQHFSTVWVKTGDGWKMKFHQRSVSHWGDW